MLQHHHHGAGMQVARPRIIAKPGPHAQDIVERGARQRPDVGPARDELLEVGPDRLDPGLLQHDLGKPDPVRVGQLAGRRPPRQLAPVPVVPGEQVCGAVAASHGGERLASRC